MRLIDADKLDFTIPENPHPLTAALVSVVKADIDKCPTIDAVPVVRCKDCIYFHKEHVLCNDGTEKDFSEFPPEAFGPLGNYVTGEYGINVGSKCEIDTNNGYSVDKSVFRNKDDFCSRGKRKDGDGNG